MNGWIFNRRDYFKTQVCVTNVVWWSKVTSSHANSHQQMIILKGVILADFLLRIPILGLHYIIKSSSTKN